MKMTILELLLLCCFCAVEARDKDFFSSTFEMQRLLRQEVEFSGVLHDYERALTEQLERVRRVIRDLYPGGPLDVADPEDHVANPINGFGMMRRLGGKLYHSGFPALMEASRKLPTFATNLTDMSRDFPR